MSSENAKQIDRLIRFWPSSPVTDEAMQAYGEAIAGADPKDVRKAVDRLISADVKRNAEYIPPPGQVAHQVARAKQERLEWEERQRPRATALPPPSNTMTLAERQDFIARVVTPAINDMRRASAGPSPEEHMAAVRRTIAEAMSIDTAKLDAMIAALPDRKQKNQAA